MKIMISSLKNKYHLFSEQKLQCLLVCWTHLSCNTTKNDKYKKQHISLQFTFPFDTFNISAYPSVNYSFILKQCKLKSVILKQRFVLRSTNYHRVRDAIQKTLCFAYLDERTYVYDRVTINLDIHFPFHAF